MIMLSAPMWFVVLLTTTGCTIGVGNLRRNAVLKTQVKRFAQRLSLQSSLFLIYPVYTVVFTSLSGWRQVAFLFLLPGVKYMIKRLMKRALADYSDLVPALVVAVDLFNALYQSKCMQSSGSILAKAGIIGIDLVQNILTLRALFGCVRELESLLNADQLAIGVVDTALEIASQPAQLDADELLAIQATSSAHFRSHFQLSEKHAATAELIRSLQEEARRRRRGPREAAANRIDNKQTGGLLQPSGECGSRVQTLSAAIETRPSSAVVTPMTPNTMTNMNAKHMKSAAPRWTHIFRSGAVQPVESDTRVSRCLTGKEKAVVLKRTLELLWRCELVLLVEYVEAAIPVLYAIYLAILYQLPNAQYYPETASMNSTQIQHAIASLLIYGILELFSLVFVHLVLERRCKLSPLHQLAFTLESEWLLIQGTFIAWVVSILPFTLAHHGADFTFRFAWVATGATSH